MCIGYSPKFHRLFQKTSKNIYHLLKSSLGVCKMHNIIRMTSKPPTKTSFFQTMPHPFNAHTPHLPIFTIYRNNKFCTIWFPDIKFILFPIFTMSHNIITIAKFFTFSSSLYDREMEILSVENILGSKSDNFISSLFHFYGIKFEEMEIKIKLWWTRKFIFVVFLVIPFFDKHCGIVHIIFLWL